MDDKILKKIQALLDLAGNNPNEHEAARAIEKATELMVTNRVDAIMLAAAATGRPTDSIGESNVTIEAPYPRAKSNLLGWIAHALGCEVVINTMNRIVKSVTIIGYNVDREHTEFVYTLLLLQAWRGMEKIASTGYASATRSKRKSYLIGFAERAATRLEEATRKAVQDTPGTGLVLVDRDDKVKAAFAKLYPDLKTPKSALLLDEEAAEIGARDAEQADLGQDRIRTNRNVLN